MPGPKPLPLELSDRERRVLRGWLRKQTASQALVLRSRIVLACAEGLSNARVADDLGVSRETVRKWRSRFAADRLEGLVDRPRSGAPRKITDEQVEALVARTLSQTPPTGVRTGRRVRWPRRRVCRSRLSRGSGGPSASSRTSWRPGSCRPTRSS
ncbi:helix-turn-helix domain-containing protein [Streptomyces sp. MUM 178J]|uniref:helix-turn-helix domain-containing protein n=1 Tax=Streptomyces sp. MUM 178J TaxID=2791991 RepID=UPI003FA70996